MEKQQFLRHMTQFSTTFQTLEEIKNYFVCTTHSFKLTRRNMLEEIEEIEFICLNVSAIRTFCALIKEDCVTDIEKEVIKHLRDRNYKHVINKHGLWERVRKKQNAYVLEKFLSILGCALTALLEDPEYGNFIDMVSILKGTYFGKVDFINTFLMDFCLLL